MTLMRMAMIPPEVVSGRGSIRNRAAISVHHGRSRLRRAASGARCSGWRRAVIESYPIAGMLLLLGYLLRTLLVSVHFVE
jgi:hypothetical protein